MANLLIVDDDRDVADSFAEMLTSHGHDVRAANSGEEGLRLLRSAPLPDVVLLDIDMPLMTGPQMAHQMLLHDAGEEHVPVVLVSASDELAQIAGRMGTPYFIAKSGGLDDYVKILDRALRDRVEPSSA